mgnify:CR=1 FL=1
MQQAQQRFALAGEDHPLFDSDGLAPDRNLVVGRVGRGALGLVGAGDPDGRRVARACTLCATSAGASSISVACQNGGPWTTALCTSKPACCQRAMGAADAGARVASARLATSNHTTRRPAAGGGLGGISVAASRPCASADDSQ